MGFPAHHLEELKQAFPNLRECEEGGCTYFLIASLALPDGCTPQQTDVLFCPTARDGYPSRLFFAEKVQSRSTPNWNSTLRIIERNWHAYSWKLTRSDLSLVQTILAHLDALR